MNLDFAFAFLIESRQYPQQCRLATTARSDDDKELSSRDIDGDAIERDDRTAEKESWGAGRDTSRSGVI